MVSLWRVQVDQQWDVLAKSHTHQLSQPPLAARTAGKLPANTSQTLPDTAGPLPPTTSSTTPSPHINNIRNMSGMTVAGTAANYALGG